MIKQVTVSYDATLTEPKMRVVFPIGQDSLTGEVVLPLQYKDMPDEVCMLVKECSGSVIKEQSNWK